LQIAVPSVAKYLAEKRLFVTHYAVNMYGVVQRCTSMACTIAPNCTYCLYCKPVIEPALTNSLSVSGYRRGQLLLSFRLQAFAEVKNVKVMLHLSFDSEWLEK